MHPSLIVEAKSSRDFPSLPRLESDAVSWCPFTFDSWSSFCWIFRVTGAAGMMSIKMSRSLSLKVSENKEKVFLIANQITERPSEPFENETSQFSAKFHPTPLLLRYWSTCLRGAQPPSEFIKKILGTRGTFLWETLQWCDKNVFEIVSYVRYSRHLVTFTAKVLLSSYRHVNLKENTHKNIRTHLDGRKAVKIKKRWV